MWAMIEKLRMWVVSRSGRIYGRGAAFATEARVRRCGRFWISRPSHPQLEAQGPDPVPCRRQRALELGAAVGGQLAATGEARRHVGSPAEALAGVIEEVDGPGGARPELLGPRDQVLRLPDLTDDPLRERAIAAE